LHHGFGAEAETPEFTPCDRVTGAFHGEEMNGIFLAIMRARYPSLLNTFAAAATRRSRVLAGEPRRGRGSANFFLRRGVIEGLPQSRFH
jgi:hypothetical protein